MGMGSVGNFLAGVHIHLFVAVHHSINIGRHILVFLFFERHTSFSITQHSALVSKKHDFKYSDTEGGGVVFILPMKKERRVLKIAGLTITSSTKNKACLIVKTNPPKRAPGLQAQVFVVAKLSNYIFIWCTGDFFLKTVKDASVK